MKKLLFCILISLVGCKSHKAPTYDLFIQDVKSQKYQTHVEEFLCSEVVNEIRIITPLFEHKPSVGVAQAILETGWGRHRKGNCYFGIKGDGITFRTREFVNNRDIYILDSFRDYGNSYDAVWDYCEFISGSRYGMSECDNYLMAVQQLDKYATAPDYKEMLISIIKKYNLETLDEIHR